MVKREVIATYSLLYTVEGSNPSLKPYILAAHMDVVPVDGQDWDVPPFEGREQDGCIYGRGTIDDKHSLMVKCFITYVNFSQKYTLSKNINAPCKLFM